ncbi:hypothetical protein [cf. Phormidesmis sp. LEGE 11477]|uniref:hypothetical protein n=1 Tax=cf. Phormidesmis sp. LEGE 11477 TaxID=1828680 RepID=UPI001882D595|nr:hypothetical protein [cf. Phormidesmis sp. LEGE 11477]MBE9063295.1 hypothetical protein [cf. Phormidesmis sp. LEGE 11477]
MYLLTEVAERERQANQARTQSLVLWAISIALVGFSLSPIAQNNRIVKTALLLSAAALTAASQSSATNLATHDRVIQDYRDISDNQRQQLVYELLTPKTLIKSAEEEEIEPVAAPHVYNLSHVIATQLKSTVMLGAPRAGKGYAIAKAVELLPDGIDLWLIDPKDDPTESYYWQRIPPHQRVRFDVTTLNPEAVDAKVTGLFERYLLAPSTAERPKLLIVDECSPGLSRGMTARAYKSFMGRVSTICSVGPSKGKFIWVLAQASTVEDLAMTSGNKASFRLAAVGHAQQTEGSWYRALKRSMGIEMPSDQLTGYIQMLDGEWGFGQPFTLNGIANTTTSSAPTIASLSPEQEALRRYLEDHPTEAFTLRSLTGKSFAKRLKLRSMDAMGQVAAGLLSFGLIGIDEAGNYKYVEVREE